MECEMKEPATNKGFCASWADGISLNICATI